MVDLEAGVHFVYKKNPASEYAQPIFWTEMTDLTLKGYFAFDPIYPRSTFGIRKYLYSV